MYLILLTASAIMKFISLDITVKYKSDLIVTVFTVLGRCIYVLNLKHDNSCSITARFLYIVIHSNEFR